MAKEIDKLDVGHVEWNYFLLKIQEGTHSISE